MLILIIIITKVVASAPTGTGKTGAFVLPILESYIQGQTNQSGASFLKQDPTLNEILKDIYSVKSFPTSVILVPTGELGLQIASVVKELSKGTDFRVCVLSNRESISQQVLFYFILFLFLCKFHFFKINERILKK